MEMGSPSHAPRFSTQAWKHFRLLSPPIQRCPARAKVQIQTKQEKYKGPVLVNNGEKESPPTLANDIEATKRMCRQQGLKVQFKVIPGANHFNLQSASIEDQMDWIADRFAGRKIPSNCETILNKNNETEMAEGKEKRGR